MIPGGTRYARHNLRKLIQAFAIALGLWVLAVPASHAQVSPAEIKDPELKALEAKYFQRLVDLNRAIAGQRFPFTFYLSRYVGLDPGQQTEADSRGIEFIHFNGRVLLKLTGNYNAAYNAERLTQNQRAAHAFQDVVERLLASVAQKIPKDVESSGVGLEVAYHTRSATNNFDYEGKEILVVVLSWEDALRFPDLSSDSQRQEVLNRADIYVDGKPYGLSLGASDPIDLETLGRAPAPEPPAGMFPGAASLAARFGLGTPEPVPSGRNSASRPAMSADPAASLGSRHEKAAPPVADSKPADPAVPVAPPSPLATQADLDRLQTRYEAALSDLSSAGLKKFHFVDYAPPSFVVFRNQVVLQMTLRNPAVFDPARGSIYRRAAQSFDLFLAAQIKDIIEKMPSAPEVSALDFTVLNQVTAGAKGASEAVEYICPLAALRQFTNSDITNQNLLDQSVILVNGVRISLNLQQAE